MRFPNARALLVDNEGDKEITVELCGQQFKLTRTSSDGHSRTTLHFPAEAFTGRPAPA